MNKQLTHYLAVTDCHGWGKDKKPQQAIKYAIANSAHYKEKKNIKIRLFKVHEKTIVNPMGEMTAPITNQPVEVGTFNYKGTIQ